MLPIGPSVLAILTVLAAIVAPTCDGSAQDGRSIFQQNETRIAAAKITTDCNPPITENYCPDQPVTRTQIAADGIAVAGITTRCDPPITDNYCPDQPVTRTQIATSISPALNLPAPGSRDDWAPIRVVLSEVERLAADRGASVAPIAAGCRLGSLDRSQPSQVILAPPGDLRFAYVTADGASTEVTWTQSHTDGEVLVEQPWRRPADPQTAMALAWQQGSDLTTLRTQLAKAPVLDVVSPIWWYVGVDGTLSADIDARYADDAHAMGKAIWPAIAGLDADRNHVLLSDPTRRAEAVRTISSDARAMGADGVNIDIEGFREADSDDFTSFVAEIVEAVHAWGGVVSYDLVPRTDTWAVTPKELEYWSTAPQRRALAEVVDYTILMSYDQFNSYRPAGPVAAPPWVEDTLVFQLRYSDPHKTILGVPFYGRVWDPDDLESPRALSIDAIENLARNGTAAWDEAYDLNRIELPDGRFLYLEDSAVLADRLNLVDEYGLAGWAAWRLGLDSATLWQTIAEDAHSDS